MRTNLATVTLSSEAPAETYAADAGQSRHPNSEALDAPDTTIVVIEKRSLVRECLASCLASQSGNRVVTFPTVDAHLDAAHANPSSLVLLGESTSPGSTGQLHDLDRLTRPSPQLSVVILADGEDLLQIRAAIDSGARGYIPSSLKLAVVVEALRLVRAGGVFVPRHQCDDCSTAPSQRGRWFSRRA